jgi:hypothetical protein
VEVRSGQDWNGVLGLFRLATIAEWLYLIAIPLILRDSFQSVLRV